MKLFGDSHKKSNEDSKERIPAPKDKSRRKKNAPAGEEIQEEYLDDEQEEYDDYDQSEYDEAADDSDEAGEYDSDEYNEYDDDEEYDDEYDEYDDDDEYDEYDEDEDDEEDSRRMSLRKKILIGVIVFLVLLLGGVG